MVKGLTVGRVVHFVGVDVQHAAAIVTRVHDDKGTVNLTVFADMEEPYFRCEVPYEEAATSAHSWHWAEQEGNS